MDILEEFSTGYAYIIRLECQHSKQKRHKIFVSCNKSHQDAKEETNLLI